MLNKKEFLMGGLYSALIVIGIMAITGFYKKNMNVLQIVEHPDPILRKVSEPVTHIDASIISLTNDIISTLRYQTMVDFFVERSVPRGLAAPQVGISKRLIVCGLNGKIKVMINPEILERKGTYVDIDNCMSVNEDKETVIRRSAYVKVRYNTLENKEKILELKDDNAALVEHEIDHLNGILNIDH
ncbi:MAG: peptide deformylase [Deltaproteobacteria bacterium]|nr:MAG: peptide deformylase [Deltaproteobacteria bacterium]